MEGRLMGFIIWGVVGILFILMGIYKICSKKTQPFGFWANAEVFPVNDVKAYNKALGKLDRVRNYFHSSWDSSACRAECGQHCNYNCRDTVFVHNDNDCIRD